jgi:hypothetical protein
MAHKSLTGDKAHAQRGCGIKVIKNFQQMARKESLEHTMQHLKDYVDKFKDSIVFLHLLLFYDSYSTTAKSFLHLFLFYDPCDSKNRGLLATTFVL